MTELKVYLVVYKERNYVHNQRFKLGITWNEFAYTYLNKKIILDYQLI